MKKKLLLFAAMIFAAINSVLAVPVDNTDYFCLTAMKDAAEFRLQWNTVNNETCQTQLEYSSDKVTWRDFDLAGTLVFGDAGDKVYLRHKGDTPAEHFSTENSVQKFVITNGKIAASGNIMSLLDKTCAMTTVPDFAFASTFKDCTDLVSAPKLPATTVGKYGYAGMFNGCTNLKSIPSLTHVKSVGNYSFVQMFYGCQSLIVTEDPDGEWYLRDALYDQNKEAWNISMFGMVYGSLGFGSGAPQKGKKYHATVAKTYSNIYCSLTPASGDDGTNASYYSINIVNDPRSIEEIKAGIQDKTTPLSAITTQAKDVTDNIAYSENLGQYTSDYSLHTATGYALSDYVFGDIEDFKIIATLGNQYNIIAISEINEGTELKANDSEQATTGWFKILPPDYLCFTAEEAGATVMMKVTTSGSAYSPAAQLQTSTDKETWTDYTFTMDAYSTENRGQFNGDVITLANIGDKVYFRAKVAQTLGNATNIYNFCLINPTTNEEKKVAASGNVMSLVNPECASKTLGDYEMRYLFYDCEGLTSAPKFPATTLGNSCYYMAFQNCTSLTKAPDLPARAVPSAAYSTMFSSCTKLSEAPNISAEKIGSYGCSSMFSNCPSLIVAPALNATELGENAYMSMFSYCTGLTSLPSLPATELSPYCYAMMFANCSGISVSETGSGTAWSIPSNADDTNAVNWNGGTFVDTGGPFTGDIEIGKTYYINNAYALPSVTLNTKGYATYSSAKDCEIKTQGVKAYYLTADSENKLTMVELNGIIPAGEGVVLSGAAGTVVEIEVSTADAATNNTGNILRPTTTSTNEIVAMPVVAYGEAIWALGDADAFQKYTGSFIANRAYIVYDENAAGGSGAKGLYFFLAGDATAVKGITNYESLNTQNGKYLENGKLVIVKDGKKYSALGIGMK